QPGAAWAWSEFSISRRHAAHCSGANRAVGFEPKQNPEFRFANSRSVRQHGLENGIELAGRRTDYAEHFRCRGLLLQRLAQIARALAQFVQYARVLDGDDGLRGEVLYQRNLLLGERAYLFAIDRDDADCLAILEHWDRE